MSVMDLVVEAKKELVAERRDMAKSEIKTRLREILEAEKTLAMLRASYESRLVEMEDELSVETLVIEKG